MIFSSAASLSFLFALMPARLSILPPITTTAAVSLSCLISSYYLRMRSFKIWSRVNLSPFSSNGSAPPTLSPSISDSSSSAGSASSYFSSLNSSRVMPLVIRSGLRSVPGFYFSHGLQSFPWFLLKHMCLWTVATPHLECITCIFVFIRLKYIFN